MAKSLNTPTGKLKKAFDALRAASLAFPEVTEEFPWGHATYKVNKKAFVFMGADEKLLSASFKLPESCEAALMMPFAEPTGYGLGKSGWVTVSFTPKDTVPVELLVQWLEESFRAIAPKKLLKAFAGETAVKHTKPASKKARTPRRSIR